jgi:hypothetical protein
MPLRTAALWRTMYGIAIGEPDMNDNSAQRIVVTDLRIPFFRLVMFFVKCALAAIPAAIILAFFAFVLTALVYVLFGNSGMFWMQRWTF